MADTHAGASSHYFIPAPSRWPMVGSIAMVFTMFGAAMVVNRNPMGWIGLAIGLASAAIGLTLSFEAKTARLLRPQSATACLS